jgi:hypothetical protein
MISWSSLCPNFFFSAATSPHAPISCGLKYEIALHAHTLLTHTLSHTLFLLLFSGRVNLVDLQPALQVDLSHIEDKARALVQHSRSLALLNGQLIANYYLDGIAEEIQVCVRWSVVCGSA